MSESYLHIKYALRLLPAEHVAIIRPSRCGSGLNILTAIHPRIPPNRKVKPILTGINHLEQVEEEKLEIKADKDLVSDVLLL